MDFITQIFLSFSHDTIIIPLVILGYIWLDRSVFYHAICLVLMSMIYNFALKITFRIPLALHLEKEGFAFPSGHMQSSVALYGWLLFKSRSVIVQILLFTVLSGIGFSLVEKGYHQYQDVMAAIGFGILLISGYILCLKKRKDLLPWLVIGCASLLMIYGAVTYTLESHLWMAYYGLLGLILTEKNMHHAEGMGSILGKIEATVACLGSILLIKMVFSVETLRTLPAFISQLQWALIGICIPLSRRAPHFVRGYTKLWKAKA